MLLGLVGCSLGAVIVFPFGPMLIVFGMFAAGTASIVLRQVRLWRGVQATAAP